MVDTVADGLPAFWPLILAAASLTVSAAASIHILLHRDEPRGALGWLGLVWLVPVGGTVLYVLFGINRIARRARLLRARAERGAPPAADVAADAALPAGAQWRELRTLMDRVNDTRLLSGNRFEPLRNGDECYRPGSRPPKRRAAAWRWRHSSWATTAGDAGSSTPLPGRRGGASWSGC